MSSLSGSFFDSLEEIVHLDIEVDSKARNGQDTKLGESFSNALSLTIEEATPTVSDLLAALDDESHDESNRALNAESAYNGDVNLESESTPVSSIIYNRILVHSKWTTT